MDAEANVHIFIDDEKKTLIRQVFDIDLNSDLFDPRYDYVAKRVLTAENPESKQALIDLLNSALKLLDGEVVVDLTVINPEIPVDGKHYKKSKFDIRVRFQNGEQGIIEVEWGRRKMISRSEASLLYQKHMQAKI